VTPRVTVLMPVRNGGGYLRSAVVSVLRQTFEDFELLVVDDGSDDGSDALVESFGDPRIRLVRNGSRLGLVASLNRGLAEARGAYVARADADDECLSDRLELQVPVLDSAPHVGVVGGWAELVDAAGRTVGTLEPLLRDRVDFVFETLVMNVLIVHPAALLRLADLRSVGGYENVPVAEDKDLWRRLLLAGREARIVEAPVLRYRLHADQVSRVRACIGRESDARSQERFLAAVSPRVDPRRMRMALTRDAELWRLPRAEALRALHELPLLLEDVAGRFALDGAERARLEARVEEHVAPVGRIAQSAARHAAAHARTSMRAATAPLRASPLARRFARRR
jgi:glycosyltransferase involved in cell wall biosynthesis